MGNYAPSMCKQIQQIENKRQEKLAAVAATKAAADGDQFFD